MEGGFLGDKVHKGSIAGGWDALAGRGSCGSGCITGKISRGWGALERRVPCPNGAVQTGCTTFTTPADSLLTGLL